MGNIFNDDFSDFISCFNKHKVVYIYENSGNTAKNLRD